MRRFCAALKSFLSTRGLKAVFLCLFFYLNPGTEFGLSIEQRGLPEGPGQAEQKMNFYVKRGGRSD